MQDLISVIIPVYQVEKYLDRCVKSVIRQTYRNLEIILVDDGSKDGCAEKCDLYAKTDNRVKVVHKEYGGVSSARNAGLKLASGKYFTFVDSDDFVIDNYVELLYSCLIDNGLDISVVGVETFSEIEPSNASETASSIIIYNQNEAIKKGLQIRLEQSVWGKLYKRELFDNILFPEGLIYEDLDVCFKLLLKTNKVGVVNVKAYKYFLRPNSIMRKKFSLDQFVEVDIIEKETARVEKAYPEYKKLCKARRLYSYFVVLRRILKSNVCKEYSELVNKLDEKIKFERKGLIFAKDVKFGLKIKIISYCFGKKFFNFVCKIAGQ